MSSFSMKKIHIIATSRNETAFPWYNSILCFSDLPCVNIILFSSCTSLLKIFVLCLNDKLLSKFDSNRGKI